MNILARLIFKTVDSAIGYSIFKDSPYFSGKMDKETEQKLEEKSKEEGDEQ